MTNLSSVSPDTVPNAEELEQQANAISDRLWAEMGTLTTEQVDALCFDRSVIRRALHAIYHPERKRCEQCGGFLKATPDEEKYSVEGDNLDEYCCVKCGFVNEWCYA